MLQASINMMIVFLQVLQNSLDPGVLFKLLLVSFNNYSQRLQSLLLTSSHRRILLCLRLNLPSPQKIFNNGRSLICLVLRDLGKHISAFYRSKKNKKMESRINAKGPYSDSERIGAYPKVFKLICFPLGELIRRGGINPRVSGLQAAFIKELKLTLMTLSGKLAISATWIPKLWSQTPEIWTSVFSQQEVSIPLSEIKFIPSSILYKNVTSRSWTFSPLCVTCVKT